MEHYKVFIEVIVVTRVKLVEVGVELGACVVVGSHTAVEVGHTQRVTVEDDTDDARCVNGLAAGGLDVDRTGVLETVGSARTDRKSVV